MSSSTTIDDAVAAAGAVGDLAGRPLRLGDPETVTAVTEVTTAQDPEQVHARLREEWGEMAPVGLEAGTRAWLVTGYRTIVAMARGQLPLTARAGDWNGHDEASPGSGSSLLRPLARIARPTVEQADGEVHQRLRTPLDDALGSIDEAMVTHTTRVVAEKLVDGFAPDGEVDLVREYVTPMAYLTVGAVLGFDAVTARQVFDAAVRPASGDETMAAVHEVSFLLNTQMTARRPDGRPTPGGLLARHSAYESAAEPALGLLSLVGVATLGLRSWLAQTLHRSLTDERFAARLAGGRLGIDEALDEVLWTASPVAALSPRIAVEDFVLGDKFVRRGDAVLLGVGAVASDPGIRGDGGWDGSGSQAHLTFGVGDHACPAPQVARLIVRTATETLYRRVIPELVVPGEELRWAADLRFRLLEALPVRVRIEQDAAFSLEGAP